MWRGHHPKHLISLISQSRRHAISSVSFRGKHCATIKIKCIDQIRPFGSTLELELNSIYDDIDGRNIRQNCKRRYSCQTVSRDASSSKNDRGGISDGKVTNKFNPNENNKNRNERNANEHYHIKNRNISRRHDNRNNNNKRNGKRKRSTTRYTSPASLIDRHHHVRNIDVNSLFSHDECIKLLDHLEEKKQWNDILGIYFEMRRRKWASWLAHKSALFAFCKTGDMQNANILYDYLLEKKKRDREGRNILSKHILSAMISGLKDVNRYNELLSFYENWEGETASTRTKNVVMTIYNKAGRPKEAIDIFLAFDQFESKTEVKKEGKKAHRSKRDRFTYNIAISSYAEVGEYRNALDLLHKMNEVGIKPDVYSFSAAITACANQQRWNEALSIFQYMKDEGVKPNVVVYGSIITAVSRSWSNVEAQKIFDEMISSGISPNDYTYTSLIEAYSRTGNYRESLKIFDRMKVEGVKRTLPVYTAVITACARSFCWQEALRVLHSMLQDSPVTPDVIVFGATMVALTKARQWDIIFEIYDLMQSLNIPPNTKIFNFLLQAHASKGEWQKAEALINYMNKISKQQKSRRRKDLLDSSLVDFQTIPTSTSVSTSAPISLELVDNSIFTLTKNHDITPDYYSYQHLIVAYLLGGNLENAINTFIQVENNLLGQREDILLDRNLHETFTTIFTEMNVIGENFDWIKESKEGIKPFSTSTMSDIDKCNQDHLLRSYRSSIFFHTLVGNVEQVKNLYQDLKVEMEGARATTALKNKDDGYDSKTGFLSIDDATYSYIVEAFYRGRNLKETKEVIEDWNKSISGRGEDERNPKRKATAEGMKEKKKNTTVALVTLEEFIRNRPRLQSPYASSIKEFDSFNEQEKILQSNTGIDSSEFPVAATAATGERKWEEAVYGLRRMVSSSSDQEQEKGIITSVDPNSKNSNRNDKRNEILSSYHHANISTLDYQVSILSLLNDSVGKQWPVALYLYDEMLSKSLVRLNVMNILFRDMIKMDSIAFQLFHQSLFRAAEHFVPEVQIYRRYAGADGKANISGRGDGRTRIPSNNLTLDLHHQAKELSKISLLQAFKKIANDETLQQQDLVLIVGRGNHSPNQKRVLGEYIQDLCTNQLLLPLKLRGIRNSERTGRLIVPAEEIEKFNLSLAASHNSRSISSSVNSIDKDKYEGMKTKSSKDKVKAEGQKREVNHNSDFLHKKLTHQHPPRLVDSDVIKKVHV